MNSRLFFFPVDHYFRNKGEYWSTIPQPSMEILLQALDELDSKTICPEVTLVVVNVKDHATTNPYSGWSVMETRPRHWSEKPLSIAAATTGKTNIIFAGAVYALKDVFRYLNLPEMPNRWYTMVASTTESRALYEIVGDDEHPVKEFKHLVTGIVVDASLKPSPANWADDFEYPSFAAGGDGAMG